jgi:RNA polymerase sigma-70 factor (ECF subfamily)
VSAPPTLEETAAEFDRQRPRLFGIAYRMLGSATEAEDVVQDVWLRWQGYDRSVVREPAAFLTTTTTRVALNVASSARARRETYVGPWLPEPVDTSADPQLGAERAEALELAVLLLLERLTPVERAAYVLRTAFDYPYAGIAEILDVSEVNARQLVSRAGKHLAAERGTSVDRDEQRRLLDAFVSAARAGDLAALEELFAADVASYTDGVGVARAARVPVVGRQRVASFVAAFSRWFWAGTVLTPVEANGHPAVLIERAGETAALLSVSAAGNGIDRLLWVMTPAKLTAFVPGATDHS